jgi:hypothetical protein
MQHLEADRVFASDELIVGIDTNIQVIKQQVVIRSITPIFAAQGLRARGSGRGVSLLRPA